MNILNWLQENLHIDGVIVLIVIAAGFFQNRYMKTIKVSKDEKYFRKLFPQKEDFEELNIVVWHNPEAVTYYHNKIFELS